MGNVGASRFTVKLSRQQSAPGGPKTQAEALSEFRGVQRQQHQADSPGVVSLQDRGLPGETDATDARFRRCVARRSSFSSISTVEQLPSDVLGAKVKSFHDCSRQHNLRPSC